MKTLLFVAALCLLPFQSATAEDISIDGQTYRLETVRPVRLDSFGRVVPMPPMTVLIPVRTTQIEQRPTPQVTSHKTRTFLPQTAKSSGYESAAPNRIARANSSTPDVARPIFDERSTFARTSFSDEGQQQLASTRSERKSSMVFDSRAMNRQVF